MTQDTEAGRNIVQHLGDIFANDGLNTTAAARFRAMLCRRRGICAGIGARVPALRSGFGFDAGTSSLAGSQMPSTSSNIMRSCALSIFSELRPN
jgi:hypothetical protein